MRRKDMKPGVLYAIRSNGLWRPGLVHNADHAERIRVRVYWTWPPADFDASSMDYRETDYLDPHPDILSPFAKYDDKTVKTGDVLQEWEPWALQERADRNKRLADLLAKEAQEEADKAAEQNSIRERLAKVDHLLANASGYLDINHLESDVDRGWTHNRYSAKDVLELLESISEGQGWRRS